MRLNSSFPRTRSVRRLILALSMIAAFGTGACSTATRFYTLSRVDGETSAAGLRASAPAAVIGVGPVSLPDYVDRPQIVVRTGPYTLAQATFDQWGGDLDDMVPRLLIEDLAARLPTDHLVPFPQVSDVPFDYRVSITISQFDVSSAGEAVVAAGWQVHGKSGTGTVLVRDSVARAQADSAAYSDRVAALSRAVAALTDEIAAALAVQPRSAAASGGPRSASAEPR